MEGLENKAKADNPRLTAGEMEDMKKYDGSEVKRFGIELPVEFYRWFKKYAVDKGMPMRDILLQILQEYKRRQ